jgi:tRNA G18 (ribose-2'-O)-methylase SpoU
MQLTHYTSQFKKQKFTITLVCDNVTNAPNIGSLFRIADAFGIEKLILCGTDITIGRKIAKTSRATENYVNYNLETDILKTISALKNNHHQIIAIEITEDSLPISEFQFIGNQSIVLVIGDENSGVSESVLKLTDTVLHINMFGNNSSMNVTQATSVVLYEITKQLQKL